MQSDSDLVQGCKWPSYMWIIVVANNWNFNDVCYNAMYVEIVVTTNLRITAKIVLREQSAYSDQN